MKKQITYWLSVIVVGIALGLTLQFVRAWTEPTEAPPGGNVGAPINTGSADQNKTGWFTFQGGGTRYDTRLATLGGNVGIGTASPSQKLDVTGGLEVGNVTSAPTAGTIRWTGTDFEGFDGTTWKSFTAGGGTDTVLLGQCGEYALSNPYPEHWHNRDCRFNESITAPAYCSSSSLACACTNGTPYLMGYTRLVIGDEPFAPYQLYWTCRIP